MYLTHSLIANKSGFGEIFRVYNNDEIIKHAKKIKAKLKKDNCLPKIKGKTFEDVLNMKNVNEAKNWFGSENVLEVSI